MNTPDTNTPGNLAEQAGNHTAFTALAAMRKEKSQAVRLEILIDSLIDVFSTTGGHERAFMGFATGLLATLDKGLGVSE